MSRSRPPRHELSRRRLLAAPALGAGLGAAHAVLGRARPATARQSPARTRVIEKGRIVADGPADEIVDNTDLLLAHGL